MPETVVLKDWMEGGLPAALLAEPLFLAANDHQRRLRVRLADLVPAVVLAEPAEVGSAPIDGARLRDAAADDPAGPPRCPGRSWQPRAPYQAKGEILELYLGGGGRGGGRPGKGHHGRAPVRRRAPGRRLGCHRPVHVAGQRNERHHPIHNQETVKSRNKFSE
jgi:hypothetical protein